MKRVTGIGGIFFKAKDAPSLQAWYKRHLGIDVQAWGGAAFTWTDAEGKPVAGTTDLVHRFGRRRSVCSELRLPSWSTTGWKTSTPWSRS